MGSLPAQMQGWKETKALYRLLDEPDVSFAALMQPHLQQAREHANASPVVLLVQDTTDIDVSHRRKISGVGHIGNERGRGFFVQTVLAVRPETREVQLLAKLGGWEPHTDRKPGKSTLLRGLSRLLEMLATQTILSDYATAHQGLPPKIAAL